jgi:enoyl-CoA hydratase
VSDLVRIERDGDVALIVLDRPEARNAMNVALASQTVEAIDGCQDAAVIVLTGRDPAFCAGLDLRNLGVEHLRDLPRFIDAAAASEVPIIAAVNGAAVTGGFELALACDFIIASERARFADTHLRVGVYPGPVGVDLPRRVGMAYAREMSLTGDFVDATEALRIGLVNHVVPHQDLVTVAMAKARSIAEQPRDMVAMLRKDWTATDRLPLEDARRVHYEHAARGGFGAATGATIASRRDAVIARARQSAPK